MIKLGILGANGRMGKEISSLVASEYFSHLKLHAGVSEGESFEPLLDADVIIEFSLPHAVDSFVDTLEKNKLHLPLVCGSTGWKDRSKLEAYALKAPVIQSSNFSLGIALFHKILQNAAPAFKKLKYEPSIKETHHAHKIDTPSGTAISIQKNLSIFGKNIPITSLREGEVIGDHITIFTGKSDHFEIKHSAHNRSVFARGAIEAAIWLFEKNKKPLKIHQEGVFNFSDFLEDYFEEK